MIHPEHKFLIYWDLVILLASVYIAIEIPLVIVFKLTEPPLLLAFDWLVTIIFITDIVISFNTAIYEKGKVITDRKVIAWRYLKSWFFIDFIAAFPFGLFINSLKYVSLGKLIRLLRLGRLIKLIRITGVFQKAGRSRINPAIMRLFILIFWILLIAHFIACCWIYLTQAEATGDNVHQYIRAFYWTMTTLTTIGYGDITPTGNYQTIFVIIIELAGAAMYGLIIGNIANLIANIDIAKTQFKEKMKIINTFLKYRNIPEAMQQKVNKYYNYLWESRRGYDEASILQDLPLPLQTDISLYLNKDIIEKVPIFQGASDELKKEIILNLLPVVFTPGDNVVTAGEVGNDMYFLSKGSVDVLSKDGKRKYATLTEGQFFGEIALLLMTPRTATIQAREFCDLFRLDKETFDRILSKYPDFEQYVRKMAEERKQEVEAVKSANQESPLPAPAVLTIPAKVPGLVVKVFEQKVHLSWEAVPGAEVYEVIKKQQISEKWKILKKELQQAEIVDPVIDEKGRNFYRVRAINAAGSGPWSDIRIVDFHGGRE